MGTVETIESYSRSSLPSPTTHPSPRRRTDVTRNPVRTRGTAGRSARTSASTPCSLGYMKWSWCVYPSVGTPIADFTTSSRGGSGPRPSTHSTPIRSAGVFQIFSLYGRRYASVIPGPKR